MKKLFSGLVAGLIATVAAASLFAAAPAFAAEPTVHEIYQAAEAGRMDDANRMMREVLQAHPQSGKAHYIDAELLAKQGKVHEAAGELAKAEKLAPGLPFAKAEAVTKLRAILDKPAVSAPRADVSTYREAPAAAATQASTGSFPMGLVLAGVGLVAFIFFATRFMMRRAAPGGGYSPGGYQPAYPQGGPAPYGGGPAPGYAPPGYGYAPAPQAPGMGSQILGGLATGAAVGTGVVLAEEAVRHMMGGNHANNSQNNLSDSSYAPFQSIPDSSNDMGGSDFGVSDTSSWDDGGGSGGGGDSDWN
ncbi:MAG: hypothetical protein JWN73_994 [Betaproteobacteria bacterium]|nr:hypothetical protein [Betaproteobacteria bacterium]